MSWGLGLAAMRDIQFTEHNNRVFPNQFSKSLQVTPSELDETWSVSSTCGVMKSDQKLLSYVVWLPGYNPKIQLFSNFCYTGNYWNPCKLSHFVLFCNMDCTLWSMKNGLSYGILCGFMQQSWGETRIPKLWPLTLREKCHFEFSDN